MTPRRKPHVNLVVIGHRGAGKSTLSGHLLCLADGGVDAKVAERVKQEAEAAKRPGARFAWLLDKLKAERSRGTIELALRKFETPKIEWTLIDAPGNRDCAKNMITGVSQADIALLVVSADDSFEAGMSNEGQTREHALLAKTLGVGHVVVAVSKMDVAEGGAWSEQRFNDVQAQILHHLEEVGFSQETPRCIPVSGFLGTNLVDRSEDFPWYSGPTLMQVLDASSIPERPVAKPLRLAVQDMYKVNNVGVVPIGRIESGVLKPGMRVRFVPPLVEATILSVEMHHVKLAQAGPGDIVGLCVRVPDNTIKRGMVCSAADGPDVVEACTRFRAQVIVFDPPGEIRVGYSSTLDVHTAHVPCRFTAIESRLDRAGNVVAVSPDSIRAGDGALVELEPLHPVVVETFEDCAPLGRFALRDSQKTVAVGIIREVTKKRATKEPPVARSPHLRIPERRQQRASADERTSSTEKMSSKEGFRDAGMKPPAAQPSAQPAAQPGGYPPKPPTPTAQPDTQPGAPPAEPSAAPAAAAALRLGVPDTQSRGEPSTLSQPELQGDRSAKATVAPAVTVVPPL